MNYAMYLNYLSKSSPEDKLFWKNYYLQQLATHLKNAKNRIDYDEKQIKNHYESIKKYESKIIELESHIKEIVTTKVD
jgi:peptidoglycan hydrolase CwlO-like protein